MPTEDQILAKNEKPKRGWTLEVDLENPVDLHKDHNGYPLTPEKKNRKRMNVRLSKKMMADELGLKVNENKLVLTLQEICSFV